MKNSAAKSNIRWLWLTIHSPWKKKSKHAAISEFAFFKAPHLGIWWINLVAKRRIHEKKSEERKLAKLGTPTSTFKGSDWYWDGDEVSLCSCGVFTYFFLKSVFIKGNYAFTLPPSSLYHSFSDQSITGCNKQKKLKLHQKWVSWRDLFLKLGKWSRLVSLRR